MLGFGSGPHLRRLRPTNDFDPGIIASRLRHHDHQCMYKVLPIPPGARPTHGVVVWDVVSAYRVDSHSNQVP